MAFSKSLTAMLERTAPGQSSDLFGAEDRFDAISLASEAIARFEASGLHMTPPLADFVQRFAFRSYAVRGDGAPRILSLLGAAIDYESGQVVQCLQQAGARSTICLHSDGSVWDAGTRLVAGRPLLQLASSFERFLEWEASLDALADEAKRWFRLSVRVPEGTTRVFAERLSLDPLAAVIDRGLGAWHRHGFLLRARRIAGELPWQLDACAADAPSADDFAALCTELLDKSPSRQLWNPG